MELIAVAIVFFAIFVPVFLVFELFAGRPQPSRPTFTAGAEDAAATWLAAHPLKPRVIQPAANDADERLAA